MKITDLKIQNFRLFKNLTINFHPQLTVLVANNGSGKTSILDAVYEKMNAKYYNQQRLTDTYIFSNNIKALNVVKSFFKGTQWEDKLEGSIDFGCGINSLIYIVNDIALNDSFDLVLIDNIELHLHPKLQQTILKRFTDTFPLIQFIVTTNSPQVLSTVRKENIRVIEAIGEIGDGIYEANMPEFSPLAHRSDDALARIMDVLPAPNLFEDDLGQYQQYVKHNQENTEKAIAIRKKLDDAGYEFHESDLSSWRFIASRKLNKGG
jgi:predicted ATP-binding protein involved in virulence